METVVRCSPRFLQSLVLAAVESFHFGTGEKPVAGEYRSREVYGHIWGYSRILSGKEPMRFLHLDLLQISLSSSRKIGEVVPNQHFLRTSHDIIGRMSPEVCLLGDFHTHTYPETSVEEVVKQRLYDFTEADLDGFYHDELLWEVT